MSALAVRSLAIAVAVAAGVALFAETRHYGLIGFDTHPLIATSRVEAPGDLTGLLVEPLMDGRYPSPFYRPVVSATFALDEALWGLEPFGYQLTGALLFVVLLLLLAALGWRLGGGSARWLAILLPAVFALYPAYYEIVPIPARRADLLCCVFAVAAVVLALGRRAGAAGVASLLAILSKESGYVTPLLVFAAGWLFGPTSASAGRLRSAARLAAPAAALAGLALIARLVLLGGLGGHRGEFSVTAILLLAPDVVLELLRGSALFGPAGTPAAWAALIAGFALAGAGLVFAREAGSDPVRQRLQRVLAFGAVWLAAFAGIYAVSGWVGSWYFLLPAVGIAVGFSSLLGWLVRSASSVAESIQLRGLCVAAALVLSGVGLWQASFAPFFRNYGEWQRASEVGQEFLVELDRRIEAGRAGQVIDAPPLPMWAHPREGIPGVEGAAVFSDYSVQAWADLVHPDRRIRVLGIEEGVLPREPGRAAPDELVIRLTRRRVGY